jgi:flagellar assembly protein FliH
MTLLSDTTPKERQTAYQRWELASFGDDRPSQAQPPAPAPMPMQEPGPVPEPEPSPESIAKINEQLAIIREEARQNGYADGITEGRTLGLIEGRVQAADERARFQQISEAFSNEVTRAHDVIASDLLMLALDIAKSMLKTALTVKPELILPIVGDAVRYLPSLQQPALLFLHPEDVTLVKEHLGDELTKAGWRVTEDTQLERGGCRIDTASNQIDASITNRWKRVTSSLGQESNWLDTTP